MHCIGSGRNIRRQASDACCQPNLTNQRSVLRVASSQSERPSSLFKTCPPSCTPKKTFREVTLSLLNVVSKRLVNIWIYCFVTAGSPRILRMDSRFAHLYKRDSSVSMIRLKMSRRRSQSQKENREKMQNVRRQLDQLPEIELSMDASCIMATQDNASKTKSAKDVNAAAEERKKMLARYKENKTLQKEKEKREKEKKGVFKVSLYKPQPLGYLPSNSARPVKGKIAEPHQTTRVTRSMMQNQKLTVERQAAPKKVEMAPPSRAPTKNIPKPLASTKGRIATVEPSVRAPTTRSASKTKPAAVTNLVAADTRAPKTRSTVKCPSAPSSGKDKAAQGDTKINAENKPAEKKDTAVESDTPKEDEKPKAAPSSFAPQGFVFQPPDGLRSFQPEPLSPRSATAFLSPSFLSEPSTETTFPSPPKVVPPAATVSSPPPSLLTPPPDHHSNHLSVSSSPPAPSTPQPSSSAVPSPPSIPVEPQHDVAYFRAVMVSETERLTVLSELWQSRFDDTSIPEETRDLMRTAVGQARLLMKERFGQFSGLVDDCDLGRGEKITTCTDLQGFWDMVYFQVEDVNKKFNALKEAEARDWKEEKEEAKPAPRKRVVIKKPPVPGGKTTVGGGASAAAKGRLAAIKAAMKAKQAAEQKATETSDSNQETSSLDPVNTKPVQTVVFHGGFFQVESPVKPSGVVRRSSRISAVNSPQCSKFTTPSRQCRSIAASHASPLPCVATTPRNHHPDVLPISTPQHSAQPQSPKAPQISLEHNQTSPDTEHCSNNQPRFDLSPTCTPRIRPDVKSPAERSHDSPSQTETELPVASSEPCPQLGESIEESMVCSPSSQENTEEKMISEEGSRIPVEAGPVVVDAEVASICGLASPVLAPFTPSKDLSNDGSPTSTDVEMTGNQDSEFVADLDFERYLQPTVRYSISPVPTLAEERFSLGAVDAEMESPAAQMSDNLLLFTPEKMERVRQSVCERDLMTFTPPTHK
nr:disks large-associated protein 5 isoform X5 [Misgurnus anguillicaudatus]